MNAIKVLYALIIAAAFAFCVIVYGMATAMKADSHAVFNTATGQVQLYDQACCNGADCEPVAVEAVEDMPDGWHVNYISSRGFSMSAVVPHGKERHSRDGRFHACAVSSRFYCLYVPHNV